MSHADSVSHTGSVFDPALLSRCISCGFCLPACPTYALTANEAVVCVALVDLTATLFVLGAGNYSANAGLVKAGGWMGLLLAAIAFYLALAAVCQASYGREVLPVGHLAKK